MGLFIAVVLSGQRRYVTVTTQSDRIALRTGDFRPNYHLDTKILLGLVFWHFVGHVREFEPSVY